jgi:hypothetical protein
MTTDDTRRRRSVQGQIDFTLMHAGRKAKR